MSCNPHQEHRLTTNTYVICLYLCCISHGAHMYAGLSEKRSPAPIPKHLFVSERVGGVPVLAGWLLARQPLEWFLKPLRGLKTNPRTPFIPFTHFSRSRPAACGHPLRPLPPGGVSCRHGRPPVSPGPGPVAAFNPPPKKKILAQGRGNRHQGLWK